MSNYTIIPTRSSAVVEVGEFSVQEKPGEEFKHRGVYLIVGKKQVCLTDGNAKRLAEALKTYAK